MTSLWTIIALCLLLVGFAIWRKDFVKARIWMWRFGFVLEARGRNEQTDISLKPPGK